MDEDELDIELRSPAAVAQRCIILAALVRRLWIESLAETAHDEDLTGEAFDVRAWLQTEGLWRHLTDPEVAFLERPVGRIDENEIANFAWQTERLAALGWALGLSDLLPLGGLLDVKTVIHAVPSPWDQTAQWTRQTVLRPEAEIVRERDRAEIVEWRINVEASLRVASAQERKTHEQAIADVIREATAAKLTEDIHEGDFTIGGTPIAAFDDQALEQLASHAAERLRAVNWLCGFGASWNHVPLDV